VALSTPTVAWKIFPDSGRMPLRRPGCTATPLHEAFRS
jgi:hypothetical protein